MQTCTIYTAGRNLLIWAKGHQKGNKQPALVISNVTIPDHLQAELQWTQTQKQDLWLQFSPLLVHVYYWIELVNYHVHSLKCPPHFNNLHKMSKNMTYVSMMSNLWSLVPWFTNFYCSKLRSQWEHFEVNPYFHYFQNNKMMLTSGTKTGKPLTLITLFYDHNTCTTTADAHTA